VLGAHRRCEPAQLARGLRDHRECCCCGAPAT
jgi:hypothetical protein